MSTSLTKFAWISITAAIVTITLKTSAYMLTGSVSLLSDALESVVNLVAAIIALIMLKVAQKPPDKDHVYGHTKAEYFSSIFEGLLILIASISIGVTSVDRLMHPKPIQQAFIGIVVTVVASLVNFFVAMTLLRVGKKAHSITLIADGHHLMTDVWTSIGVVIGVGLVALTHVNIIDPIIALLIACNIVITGFKIIKESTLGLIDTSMNEEDMKIIQSLLDAHCTHGVSYHGLQTRQSATRSFMSVHILVPGRWTVHRGHNLLEKIELKLSRAIPQLSVLTHLEPAEDPKSLDDIVINRV